MPDLPGWLSSYGMLGIMLWLGFELRDVRRIIKTHMLIHHKEDEKTVDAIMTRM